MEVFVMENLADLLNVLEVTREENAMKQRGMTWVCFVKCCVVRASCCNNPGFG
jgi:hypothetical protein